MLLGALLCAEAGLTPWAKYVLVRLVQCFDLGQPVELNVKGLAKQFGIADGQVTKALKNLNACNILHYTSHAAGQGRPKRLYALQEKHLQQFQGIDPPELHQHLQAVDCLLRHEDSRSVPQVDNAEEPSDKDSLSILRARKQPERLTVINRLLLSVLLCHADRMGMVRDMGLADLCRLTGLSSERLKYRLQCLLDHQLIRSWIPGITSHALFGKAKSVYYLNLQHPIFGSCYPLAGIMIFGWKHRWEEAETLHARLAEGWEVLVLESRHLARAGEPDVPLQEMAGDHAEMWIAGIGTQAESRRIVPMLQTRLEIYASWLLSYRWDELDDQSLPCPKALDELIRRDFVEVRQKEKAELSRVADTLVSYIYTHTHGLAREVRHRLLRLPKDNARPQIAYQEHGYLILPQDPSLRRWKERPDDRWTRAVLMFSKGGNFSHGCHVFTHWYAHESELSLERRYFYGLLTKPSGKASASTEP